MSAESPEIVVERSICQVLSGDGATATPIGLGFAIGTNLVVTCAHVVNAAFRRDLRHPTRPRPEEQVFLRFPIGTDEGTSITPQTGSIAEWLPATEALFESNDIAVLQLSDPVPSHVAVARLGTSKQGQSVQVWGPALRRPSGTHVRAEIMGEVIGGRVQIDAAGRPFKVEPGFSGGPVWDQENNIVGLLAACSADGRGDAYLLKIEKVAATILALVDSCDPDVDTIAVSGFVHEAIRPDVELSSIAAPPLPLSPHGAPIRIPTSGSVSALSTDRERRQLAVADGSNAAAVYAIPNSLREYDVPLVIRDSESPRSSTAVSFCDITFDQKGTRIVTAAVYPEKSFLNPEPRSGVVKMWDRRGVEIVGVAHDYPVTRVAIGPHDDALASISGQDEVALWSVRSNEPHRSIRHPGVTALAFCPCKKLIACGGERGEGCSSDRLATLGADRHARIWDVANAHQLQELVHAATVTAAAFSADGRWLATGCADTSARVWDVASAQPLLQCRHDDVVTAVAWSPDGRRLATGSRDGRGRLWEIATGSVILECRHERAVTAVAFGESWLATGGDDKSVRIWSTNELD